jgi:hypothetical protein
MNKKFIKLVYDSCVDMQVANAFLLIYMDWNSSQILEERSIEIYNQTNNMVWW